MRSVVLELGLSLDVLEHWSTLIGVPLSTQIDIIVPHKELECRQAMASRYREIYDLKAVEVCPPFPGLQGILSRLEEAKVRIAIASSKRRALIDLVLDAHKLAQYFDIIVGSLEVVNHKPHPEPVHHIMNKLSIPVSETVVIGDSTYDLEMARNAGVDSIGVTTGIHSRELLATIQPLHIVSALQDALPLILNGRMTH